MTDIKRYTIKLTLAAIFILIQFPLYAQCAMCRSSVENNASNGDTALASSLNTGILYLFAMPYLLVFIIGTLWYVKSKRNIRK